MLASKKWIFLTMVLVGTLSIVLVPRVQGVQDIKEDLIISGTLRENLTRMKVMYRYASEMIQEAGPFLNPHHRARYRFSPSDRYARSLMDISRKMHLDMSLMRGLLSDAQVTNRDAILKSLLDGCDSINVFGKRALRARRDGNFALYIASAQGAQKGIKELDNSLAALEIGVNASIRDADARQEDL